MTKRQIYVAVSIAAAIAGIFIIQHFGFLSALREVKASEGPVVREPMPVNVKPIEQVGSVQEARKYTGTIRAKQRSDLGFELSGTIVNILVEEGDSVSEGDELAKLDTATLVARKNAIQANLAQAKSILNELEAGPRKESIDAARANAAAAESQLNVAKLNLERRERLIRENAISKEEYDQALFGYRTAKSTFDSANEVLNELIAGTRKEKINAQMSTVAQLEASVQEIDVSLAKSSLVAPFSGVVTKRYFDPGAVAQASQPIIKLVQQDKLEAWIGLPVESASVLRVNDQAKIWVGDQSYVARVAAKIKELDRATRTQTLVFELEPDAANSVVSGQLCEIEIVKELPISGFWVPTKSLAKGVRGLWSVMVVTEEEGEYRARKRDIEIINTQDSRVLTRGTVQSGDMVVIDGLHRIADGQLVEPQKD